MASGLRRWFAAQDHKRIGDGDTGPNTGGMGAYSTSGLIDDNMRDWLLRHIARPVIAGMAEEGMPYTGILYCGLMMTARGPAGPRIQLPFRRPGNPTHPHAP